MSKETFSHFNRLPLNSPNSTNSFASSCERDLKVDKRILEIMRSGGNDVFPSASEFFGRIIQDTGVSIEFSSTFKDRQGNEIPIIKVLGDSIKNCEEAVAMIMEYLDPHRDKMTFNIDVPFNDHSYIIGKDGSRIKQLSRETGCHIHLPDCNKTSGKKSNKLSIAGTSFESIEQARNQIRKSLPLNIGFKARIKSRKFVHIDTSSSEVQAIKRKYRVDVTFTNVISNNKCTEVTINVKGGRSQLEEIRFATHELYYFVTGEEMFQNPSIDFTITIDISHSHHQYVKGKNNCNLKVIHQRSKSSITFPPSDIESNQVVVQGKDLLSTVMGWQELMGYLPLLLSFDVNFDITKMQYEVQRLEKEYGVGIRTREKLCNHVYTVLIKTQERHSICLQEIRQRILSLKAKADKACDENGYRDSYCANGNNLCLDGLVNAKTAGFYAYNQISNKNQMNFSVKSQRLSLPQMSHQQQLYQLESYRNFLYPYTRKHKGLNNKHSSMLEHNYITFATQLMPNIMQTEMSPKLCNISSLPMDPVELTNSIKVEDNLSPLKVNSEMNYDNGSVENILPTSLDTVNHQSRPRVHSTVNMNTKVDYSFNRYTYQAYGKDDYGLDLDDSSPQQTPVKSKYHQTVKDKLYVNQENTFPNALTFYPSNLGGGGGGCVPLQQANH